MTLEILQSFTEQIGEILHSKFLWSGSRHYWLYMLGYVVIAYVVYRQFKYKYGSFLSFLFPRDIYTHPSNILDIKIWLVIMAILHAGFLSVVFAGVYYATALIDNAFDLLGPGWQVERISDAPKFHDRLLFMIVVTVCTDFGFFIMHYIYHRISWLWVFHRVHHSAEVLTPITANRHHPVDYMLEGCSAFLIGGIGATIFTRFHGIEVDKLTILNVSAIHFFYYMTANFRHSHIWLGYGKWGSRIFISPAMHHIHHSTAPEHRNKNFGFIFSFWDGLFGTRYIPVRRENVEFGLSDSTAGYTSLIDAMVRPFKESLQNFKERKTWVRS